MKLILAPTIFLATSAQNPNFLGNLALNSENLATLDKKTLDIHKNEINENFTLDEFENDFFQELIASGDITDDDADEDLTENLSTSLQNGRGKSRGKRINLAIIVRVYFQRLSRANLLLKREMRQKKRRGEVLSTAERENVTRHEKNLRYAKFLNQLAKAKKIPEDPKIRYSLMFKIYKNDPGAQFDIAQLNKVSGFGDPSLESMNRQLTCAEGGCVIPLSWEDIHGYGCWCNFDQQISKGYGLPIDPWDEVCRSAQLCTRCIQFDQTNNDKDTCDLVNTSYKNNISFNANTETIESDCEADNSGDSCAIGLCQCELQMYREMHVLTINSAIPANTVFKHENGFDRLDENNCPRRGNTFEASQCCGNYPTRYPFNDFLFQCCDDQVNSVGSC